MTADLVDQLAAYGAQQRAAQAPIEMPEVVAGITEVPLVLTERQDASTTEVHTMTDTNRGNGRTGGSQRWMLAGAAAAIVAIVGVVGLILVNGDDDEPSDLRTTPTNPTDPTDPATTASPTVAPSVPTTPRFVIPADALSDRDDGVTAPTFSTPLPDFDNVVIADTTDPPRALDSVEELPAFDHLDFLQTFCEGARCFRDAEIREVDGGRGEFEAGRPFHVRHGFVNEGAAPLGPGFDLALYVLPIEDAFEFPDIDADGPHERYHTDFVVRTETDRCGPDYEEQAGPVTCQWFVHEFADGLPEGRWALWAVWEAPCSAWVTLGRTDRCEDPDEVLSFFSSGVDSGYHTGADDAEAEGAEGPTVTEVDGWTRVGGLDLRGLDGDGTDFYALTDADIGEDSPPRGQPGTWPTTLFRSRDGVAWESLTAFPATGISAVRDGRVVSAEASSVDPFTVEVAIAEVESEDGPVVVTTTHDVTFDVPSAFAPFSPHLSPDVNILDDGRIVIHAGYSADEALILMAAVGLPIEQVTEARDTFDDWAHTCADEGGDGHCGWPFHPSISDHLGIPANDLAASEFWIGPDDVGFDIGEERFSFPYGDLGLDELATYRRTMVQILDGSGWSQPDFGTEISLSDIGAADGGLVARAEALVFGAPRGWSTSVDGVEWMLATDGTTGEPLPDSGSAVSAQNRAFYLRQGGGPASEVTTNGAWSPVGDIGEFSYPVAGDGGIAYLTDFEFLGERARSIALSADGTSWIVEDLPGDLRCGCLVAVGAANVVLIEWSSGHPTLWVRPLMD